jgi:hypothetical protein
MPRPQDSERHELTEAGNRDLIKLIEQGKPSQTTSLFPSFNSAVMASEILNLGPYERQRAHWRAFARFRARGNFGFRSDALLGEKFVWRGSALVWCRWSDSDRNLRLFLNSVLSHSPSSTRDVASHNSRTPIESGIFALASSTRDSRS